MSSTKKGDNCQVSFSLFNPVLQKYIFLMSDSIFLVTFSQTYCSYLPILSANLKKELKKVYLMFVVACIEIIFTFHLVFYQANLKPITYRHILVYTSS